MNHAPSAGSITGNVDLQFIMLPLCNGCPHIVVQLNGWTMLIWTPSNTMIDWCFRPRFCTVSLYSAGDNLGEWDVFCYESCPWRRIDHLTCWPVVQHATTSTVPRMPPTSNTNNHYLQCCYQYIILRYNLGIMVQPTDLSLTVSIIVPNAGTVAILTVLQNNTILFWGFIIRIFHTHFSHISFRTKKLLFNIMVI